MSPRIAVDLAAMDNDAKAWECVSGQLEQVGGRLDDVSAPSQVFRCAPSGQAVANAYAQVLRNTRAALAAGTLETSHGAAALVEIADAFRADEEAAVDAYESEWERLGQ